MSSIALETRGRRTYITGNTYPLRSAIKAAGCRWDADAQAWWTGKRETAEALVSDVGAGKVELLAGYAKLADGSWGVRVPGAVEAGATVTVETKAGARKTETILAVLSTDERGSLCSVAQRPRRSSGGYRGGQRGRARGRWTGCSCGSIEDHPRDSDCASCQHDY